MTKIEEFRHGMAEDGDFKTKEVEWNGTVYTLRELSVDDVDEINDATTGPDDKVNYRLNTRLSLAKSIQSPAVHPDEIGKWPTTKYTLMIRAFNNLNTIDTPGNAPSQNGSSEPTSPTSGEPTPSPSSVGPEASTPEPAGSRSKS